MNRGKLERYLRAQGFRRFAEGGRHTKWENRRTGAQATIPRHREIAFPVS